MVRHPRKLLFVFGTRPEAIKLAPVLLHAQQRREFIARTCVTAQHRGMLDQVLAAFRITPEHDLDCMQPGQTLTESTSRILAQLEPVLRQEAPDLVIVQGDTTTTLCGALAAFYQSIPVGHVEAGLRTGDLAQPFPEEMNRVVTTRLAAIHFAPTARAAGVLGAECVPPDRIFITGNSGIDAVLYVRDALESGALPASEWPQLDTARQLIVVTAHRRESFGGGFESLCEGIARIARREDVQIAYPVHRNPRVMEPVNRLLANHPNILLLDPLDYIPFVDLMRRATILLTDSGGIQEEGPSLGKPVLVMREKTERPEAVEAGTVRLVGTDPDLIEREAARLLDDDMLRTQMSRIHNPYGDGTASRQIADAIAQFLETHS
ncbi:MAG TPA: UDP-N-acetylglucosamine 2-epimerase (non-hydrolyzing) [Candidatus Solibacter sp.]|nr:UDP-N-acetylglucosamine 2-epimerase (non-hydrolyzing) [Candidatus Solibacter sp.]